MDSISYVVCRLGEEPVQFVGGLAWRVNDCGIQISLLALRVDLRGIRSKPFWIRLVLLWRTRSDGTFSFTQTSFLLKLWFQRQMLFLFGGWMLNRGRNARCTAVAHSVFNELKIANKNLLHSSHFALNWRCCRAVCWASALAVVFKNESLLF
jgi:hypothetical protein